LIKLMREREPLYAQTATISVATDDAEVTELVESIVAELDATQSS
jgi:shikimate kinase